ncbi:MAG: hypothetical protein OER88_04350 [Planctomycetota bacterium]|nr:hypothetical protein [Planctomycetota bacterium]
MSILRLLGIGALLCGTVACTAFEDVFDKVTLSEAELRDVAENYAAALAAFHDLEEFAVDVANGTIDVGDALTFTVPEAANNWTGTLSYLGPDLPGGDGSLTVTFRIVQDGVPVDPFAADLSTTQLLTAEMTVVFDGFTRNGVPMALDATFTTSYDRSVAEGKEDVATTGTFFIDHGGYVANLSAQAFTIRIDKETSTPESSSGRVTGSIDIPDFAFDADVDIDGRGEVIHIEVDVLDQSIDEGDIAVADF